MLLGTAESMASSTGFEVNVPGRQMCFLAVSRLRERLPPYATAVSFLRLQAGSL